MRILYSLINFLILAAGLFLVGRGMAKKIFQNHRDQVDQGLADAQKGKELAATIHESQTQLDADNQTRLRELESEAQAGAEQAEQLRLQARNQAFAEAEGDLHTDQNRYRMGMLQRVESALLRQISDVAAAEFSQDPFASAFRKYEPMIVERILEHIELSPGDTVYLIKHSVLYITLTSAYPLDQALVDKIGAAVDEKLAAVGGKASYWVRVEPSLIGGLRLRIGDTVFDGTIANYLFRMRQDSNFEFDETKADESILREHLFDHVRTLSTQIDEYQLGRVLSVSDGICYMDGLADIMYGELVEFDCGEQGMVLDIEDSRIACVVFGAYEKLQEGERVRRIGRVMSVPVGERFLGRVINSMGQPIDGKGEIRPDTYRPIESDAPAILDRKSVSEPLQTGLVAIDSLVPIGKGQRELIIGDRQTGKTAIALDTILNQKGKDVICIYVAIGQKETTVAGMLETLKKYGALDYTIIISADAYDSAPMQYIAPYAGAAMGEYFMYQGKDVLIVYDDLSKHAVAYRELSLLLHRPSGREAYPGDVFYLHSRLLERSARLSPEAGGGSMTALPIIETQAGDISAYIPTNVISITDGQIFLDTDLFHEGLRPAINVGLSVSRVGGAAQIGAMKQVAGQLRMTLAQYRELQTFSQFGSDLDTSTKAALALGDRMTAVLKQPQYSPLPANKQVLIIFAVANHFADDVDLDRMEDFETALYQYFEKNASQLLGGISGKMSGEFQQSLKEQLASFKETWQGGDGA